MNISHLNEDLAGIKIISVEEGTTPGWMVLNLETPNGYQDGFTYYLTVWVGGRKEEDGESRHHWTSALHATLSDGGGTADPIRDGRNPEMPMSAAWHDGNPVLVPQLPQLGEEEL